MNVYYLIFYAIFPIISIMFFKCQTNRSPKFGTVPPYDGTANPSSKQLLFQTLMDHLKKILCSTSKIAIFSFIFLQLCSLIVKDKFATNTMSIGALTFVILATVTMLGIIKVGSSNLIDFQAENERCIAATLTILFPVMTAGKIIFALSLLTLQGQMKAMPYMIFERSEWESFCKNELVCASCSFLQYDIVRYAILVCFPIHLWSNTRRIPPQERLSRPGLNEKKE
jgi:hypothetical protein